jgi:transcriptional regulator with XRE-family HTH domain
VATLNVIRRWALREQMSIREISRRTGLARNTVKKYLRSDETEPTYAKRASPSKLDPYAEKLATWLEIEATKSRKQRRNLKQIYTLNRRRRRSRTYPHREHLLLTKSVGQELMERLGQASAQFHTYLKHSWANAENFGGAVRLSKGWTRRHCLPHCEKCSGGR